MLVLSMTAPCSDNIPPVLFYFLNYVAHFHEREKLALMLATAKGDFKPKTYSLDFAKRASLALRRFGGACGAGHDGSGTSSTVTPLSGGLNLEEGK